MIQFIVGALAVVGLSELAKSKKMPKMANGGGVGVGNDLELLKNKIETISKKMEYDGESGYGGYVVYLGGDRIQISNYSDLVPYSAQANDTEVIVSFNAPNRTMVKFSNRVNEPFQDNKSFEKYGGIKYIYEPLTDKIASQILEKVLSEKYADGGGVNDSFDPLNLPITYTLVNNDGEVIFKTNSFNKAVDTRNIKSLKEKGKLKLIATDKSGNKKIIASGVNEKGNEYANGGSMSDDYLIDDDEYESMSDTKKSRVEKFFSLLFESRDVAHKEHLKTKSYATHIALNEYYDGVLPLIDGLVESYQGIYGIVEIPEWTPKYENPIIYLKDLLNTIDREKDELFTDSSLLNQVDEIKALVQSTLYKLENLK